MAHSAIRITFVLSLLIACSVQVFAKKRFNFQTGTVIAVNEICDDFCLLRNQYSGTDAPLLPEHYAYDVAVEVGGQVYVLLEDSQSQDAPKILENQKELIAISGKVAYIKDVLDHLTTFAIISRPAKVG